MHIVNEYVLILCLCFILFKHHDRPIMLMFLSNYSTFDIDGSVDKNMTSIYIEHVYYYLLVFNVLLKSLYWIYHPVISNFISNLLLSMCFYPFVKKTKPSMESFSFFKVLGLERWARFWAHFPLRNLDYIPMVNQLVIGKSWLSFCPSPFVWIYCTISFVSSLGRWKIRR